MSTPELAPITEPSPISAPAPEPAAAEPAPRKRTRAEINRANAQKSTGPKSSEGLARSSRNSFKHGLYATALCLPTENPAELDALRASLRSEHQPANTTEDILVNELAENFWRIRRMRERETFAFQPDNVGPWMESGLLTLLARSMASAERAFHRALHSLRQLQKARGFVPQISVDATEPTAEPAAATPEPAPAAPTITAAPNSGFVPQNPAAPAPAALPELQFLPLDPAAFGAATSEDAFFALRESILAQLPGHKPAAKPPAPAAAAK